MLSRFKNRLDPPGMSEAEAIKQREGDPVLAKEPIWTFARVYKPRFWWYEVYNMLRRLALTSMVLGCKTLAQTTVFVVAVSILTLVIERESEPFLKSFLSAFTYCMHWQIVLFVQFQLLIDAKMTSSAGAVMISFLLLFTNLLMVLIVIIDTRTNKYRERLAKEGRGSAFILAATVLEESGVAPAVRRTLRTEVSGLVGNAENPMYAAGAGITTERVGADGEDDGIELTEAEVKVKVDSGEKRVTVRGPLKHQTSFLGDDEEVVEEEGRVSAEGGAEGSAEGGLAPPSATAAAVAASQWKEVTDDFGRAYYHNTETDETSWGRPTSSARDPSLEKPPLETI